MLMMDLFADLQLLYKSIFVHWKWLENEINFSYLHFFQTKFLQF